MDHTLLIQQIESILEDETDVIANLANVSAVIKMNMEHINWVGFYIYKESELVLGPFQGNVACTRLKDKGVCISALNMCLKAMLFVIAPQIVNWLYLYF